MQKISFPPRENWAAITQRPALDLTFLERTVANILADVRTNGDAALRHCARFFDKVDLDTFEVTREEIDEAAGSLSAELKAAIAVAKSNIEKFHAAEPAPAATTETMPGVTCWRESRPIEKVGLYVPAGTAPLFSTVLMLAVPAALAGCREVVMCSPPGPDGKIAPVILYTAQLCGVRRIFKVGGAQAIGAMAFGTETIPSVYKIFGPGNQFVTEAKQQVTRFGAAIDMPAGPSEVAVLADDSAVAAFVASDLLSQAEHGPDSQVMLVTTSEKLAAETQKEIEKQLADLPRRDVAQAALANSKIVIVDSIETGIDLINAYAPEHLILAVEDAGAAARAVESAGSVFIGNYSCESAGDYASGTNHTLPTNGWARSHSGVSVDSFRKFITFQELSAEGLNNLGPSIELMAEAEGLAAHARAVSIRLNSLNGGTSDV